MTTVIFGDEVIGGAAINGSNGDCFAAKYTLAGSASDAVLTDIDICMSAAGSHTSIPSVGVWRDVAGEPGALVGYGDITPTVGAFAASFFSVLGTGNALTLVSGGLMPDAIYWIGLLETPGSKASWQYTSPGGTPARYQAMGGSVTNPFGAASGTAFNLIANATVEFTPAPSGPSVSWTQTVIPEKFSRGISINPAVYTATRLSPLGLAVNRSARSLDELTTVCDAYDASIA